MRNVSNKIEQSRAKEKQNRIRGFLKAVVFYALLFAFWVWLFVTNEGPGGVESTHLIIIGIAHLVLVCFHAMAGFEPEQKTVSPN